MFGIEEDFKQLMEQFYGPLREKKQMTEELDPSRILKDNDCIWYMGEKYQKVEIPQTLSDKLETWIEYGNFSQSKDVLVNEILNMVKEFIPEPYKGMGLPEYSVGFNECIRRIEEKLK